MPRQPLRKLSSSTLPWPTDWASVFGHDRPLILEIGFGRGTFLLHLAQTFPDHNVIGIEISNRCLVAAERAIERLNLTNTRVVHSTAETALNHLFEPQTLEQIHINFPDPWFKTRHSHRRLMRRETIDVMVSRLQPGGLLYLATDIAAYAEMSAELLEATPELDNLLPDRWAHTMPGRVVTKYEAAAQREGRPCYYFAYRRNDLPGPSVPVQREVAVPHVVFDMPLTLDAIFEAFQPSEHVVEDVVIKFIECYRGRNVLLFDVFVNEPTIDQRLSLVLRQRQTGDFTLMMGPMGQPRPTQGVHLAVNLLSDWLTSLHPDARVQSRKVQDEAP